MATDNKMTILDVSGPFREPREPAFSYEYAIQRPMWATAHAVRVKVGVTEELDVIRTKLLGAVTGSPGQQLLLSQILTRRIADEKIRLWDAEGQLNERREVSVEVFAGPFVHFFTRLEEWLEREKDTLRAEIKKRVNL